jgi:alpha-galactosidase
MIGIAETNNKSASYAGPGHWNDPDMMEVGNGGMSTTEYKTHFSLWSIMAAPLIAGNDLRKMSQETIDIFTNKEVIAVDQDAAGIQGKKISANGDLEVWCKPLGTDGKTKAILLVNKGGSAADITVKWSDIRLKDSDATVRDLWEHKDLGTFATGFTAKAVPSHGSVLIKVKGDSIYPALPTGAVYLSDMEWTTAENGWGPVEKDMSAGGGNARDGASISIKGNSYAKGLGCQSPAQVVYNLDGQYKRFVSDIGIDEDAGGSGSVIFQVMGDGKKLYDSGIMKNTSPIQTIDIDITGVKELKLVVTDGGDGTNYDHGDWAGAYIVKDGAPPASKFEFNSSTKFSASSLIPNSTLTTNVSVTNNASVAYNGTKDVLLVVGLYDKNNTMLSVATKTAAIAYQKTQSLSADIVLPADIEGIKVRTFLWDGKSIKTSNMTPLSDVTELN